MFSSVLFFNEICCFHLFNCLFAFFLIQILNFSAVSSSYALRFSYCCCSLLSLYIFSFVIIWYILDSLSIVLFQSFIWFISFMVPLVLIFYYTTNNNIVNIYFRLIISKCIAFYYFLPQKIEKKEHTTSNLLKMISSPKQLLLAIKNIIV